MKTQLRKERLTVDQKRKDRPMPETQRQQRDLREMERERWEKPKGEERTKKRRLNVG
jgi:hypothetical protein